MPTPTEDDPRPHGTLPPAPPPADPARNPSPAHLARVRLPRVRLAPGFAVHPVVFPAAAGLIILAIIGIFAFDADAVQAKAVALRTAMFARFAWLYVGAMTAVLLFAGWLAVSPYGKIRLGRDDETPEFGAFAWLAMLFSAGMGTGLMVWGVAEPVAHYLAPPPGFGMQDTPARLALAATVYHWTLHPWALYGVVGLAMAFASFRKGLPLGFRAMLHPLLGDRVWGRLGDAIDVLAILATLTGVAASLGIGAQQVNAGLAYLFGIPVNAGVQALLIAIITACATVSVVLGLGKGIRRLSEANIVLAGLLMFAVILAGGALAWIGNTLQTTGDYLALLPGASVRIGAAGGEQAAWTYGWTVFNWAWWIAWSPFVGMFLARISRGRTLRQYLAGVVLVPTAVTLAWFAAFGATTLDLHEDHLQRVEQAGLETASADLPTFPVTIEDDQGEPTRNADGSYATQTVPLTAVQYRQAAPVSANGRETVSTLNTTVYAMFEQAFPTRALALIAVGLATVCVALFFVTSSDSASLIIDVIATGGDPDPPVATRVFWACLEGVAAAALLYAGGLQAVGAASITTALPFTVLLILACVALVKSLREERQ
ncbi:MAG: BCCT family transporter [Planctomycetota bacterium]